MGGISRFLGESLCPSLNTAYLLFHNIDGSLTPFLPCLSPGESSSTSLMRDIVEPDVLHCGLTCWIHMKKFSWILCPSKLWAHTSVPVPPPLLQLPHQQLVRSPLTFTSLWGSQMPVLCGSKLQGTSSPKLSRTRFENPQTILERGADTPHPLPRLNSHHGLLQNPLHKPFLSVSTSQPQCGWGSLKSVQLGFLIYVEISAWRFWRDVASTVFKFQLNGDRKSLVLMCCYIILQSMNILDIAKRVVRVGSLPEPSQPGKVVFHGKRAWTSAHDHRSRALEPQGGPPAVPAETREAVTAAVG